MLKFGLIGCGRIGAMHAENIARHEGCKLVAVFDPDRQAVTKLATRFDIKACPSVAELLSDAGIDAVLIASATNTHADLIEQAARAGKAIFCEKPIDLSLARVDACAAVLKAHPVPVQIGFNRRFDPGHRAARDARRAGKIGDLHQVIITSRDPELPPEDYLRVAGGLLRDMTIHDFDLARFMLDEEPVEVFAIAAAMIDPELGECLNEVDTAMIILRTADGKMCHINNSRTAVYGYDQRVELMGQQGMLLSDNNKPHQLRHFTQRHSEAAAPYQYFFVERYREAFIAEIDAFIAAVENGKAPDPSFDDGRRALILAEAAYRSVTEKRLVHVREITD